MELQTIVPWGRSLSEYKKMFSLSEGVRSPLDTEIEA